MEGFGKMLVLCVDQHSKACMMEKLISGAATNVKDDAHQSAESEIRRIEIKSSPRRVSGEWDEKRQDTRFPLEPKLYKLTILIAKAGICNALLVFIVMSIRLSLEKSVIDHEQTIARSDGSIIEVDAENKTLIKKTLIEIYASQGYPTRVLAYRDVPSPPSQLKASADSDIETDLTRIRILDIEDPVRSEVPEAIQLCPKAGIVVHMVTDDNSSTARSIAAKCGIKKTAYNSVITKGAEFRARVLNTRGRLKLEAFDGLWPKLRVMSPSSPKDKDTLVTGLMETKLEHHGPQIVAVNGDGTNDAPALKKEMWDSQWESVEQQSLKMIPTLS
ncbi:unnamed protein product [Albugo candida]|nr:unnamed protein product [Albugo candida]|eukprot:CCI43659.1 unnamed protein product [Albugo candida]